MADDKIKTMSDEELDKVTGGTMQQTKELITAFAGFCQRNKIFTAEQVNDFYSLSFEDQYTMMNTALNNNGIKAKLQLNGLSNTYQVDGMMFSHKQTIDMLNTITIK